jgi:hypothetical protein
LKKFANVSRAELASVLPIRANQSLRPGQQYELQRKLILNRQIEAKLIDFFQVHFIAGHLRNCAIIFPFNPMTSTWGVSHPSGRNVIIIIFP